MLYWRELQHCPSPDSRVAGSARNPAREPVNVDGQPSNCRTQINKGSDLTLGAGMEGGWVLPLWHGGN